jgi:hypothetical protein
MTTTIEKELTQFRETFRHKNVTVYNDSIVYRTPYGLSDKMAKDANDLIADLKLSLVAIPTSFFRKDSFHVKSNETSDI